MRAVLIAVLMTLVSSQVLVAQAVSIGDRLRIRESSEAPWTEGQFVRRDTVSLILSQAGMERVYELAAIEKVDWYKPRNVALEVLLMASAGALGWWTGTELGCDKDTQDCPSAGTSLAIGAGVGAAIGLLSVAIKPGRWTNVTDDFPPAGGS